MRPSGPAARRGSRRSPRRSSKRGTALRRGLGQHDRRGLGQRDRAGVGQRDREARGSVTVRAWDSAVVRAWQSATVEAWGRTTRSGPPQHGGHGLRPRESRRLGHGRCPASDHATVRARGAATVEARDSVTVEAWGGATVRASHGTTVLARQTAVVEARGGVIVRARDSATVRASEYVPVVTVGDDTKVEGGVVVTNARDRDGRRLVRLLRWSTPTTGSRPCTRRWMKPSRRRTASRTSPARFPRRPIGTAAQSERGGGLHLSPRPFLALRFRLGRRALRRVSRAGERDRRPHRSGASRQGEGETRMRARLRGRHRGLARGITKAARSRRGRRRNVVERLTVRYRICSE